MSWKIDNSIRTVHSACTQYVEKQGCICKRVVKILKTIKLIS